MLRHEVAFISRSRLFFFSNTKVHLELMSSYILASMKTSSWGRKLFVGYKACILSLHSVFIRKENKSRVTWEDSKWKPFQQDLQLLWWKNTDINHPFKNIGHWKCCDIFSNQLNNVNVNLAMCRSVMQRLPYLLSYTSMGLILAKSIYILYAVHIITYMCIYICIYLYLYIYI